MKSINSLKHIIFITPGFACNEEDTTCIPTIQSYFLELKKVHPGLTIHVVSLQYPSVKEPYIWNGIKVYPCYAGGVLSSLRKWLKALRYIYKLNRRNPIDLIHSFWLSESALIGWLSKRVLKVPLVCTLMGQDALPQNRYKVLAKRMTSTIAISKNQAKKYKETTSREVDAVIPWGVKISNDLPSQKRDIDVLGVGNLIALKNYTSFIDIVASLKLSFPEIKAKIIGKGEQLESLKKKVLELGLEKNIELSGELSRDEVLENMLRTKVFLHPSIYEGQGYVFYEALQTGCSVVSFDVGTALESDHWKVGDSAEELTNSVSDFLKLPVKSIQEVPDIEDSLQQYMEVYHKII